MTKPEIISQLQSNHQKFAHYLNTLTEQQFMFSYNGKWTAGQQLDHIYLSVKALARAMKVPKLLLWYKFDRANRPSKTYEQLVEKYNSRLQAGGTAPSPFVPPAIAFDRRGELVEKLNKMVNALCKYADGYNEKQLDKYIIPHPLLGKQTIREMLYFTMYHVEHHLEITKRNLG